MPPRAQRPARAGRKIGRAAHGRSPMRPAGWRPAGGTGPAGWSRRSASWFGRQARRFGFLHSEHSSLIDVFSTGPIASAHRQSTGCSISPPSPKLWDCGWHCQYLRVAVPISLGWIITRASRKHPWCGSRFSPKQPYRKNRHLLTLACRVFNDTTPRSPTIAPLTTHSRGCTGG